MALRNWLHIGGSESDNGGDKEDSDDTKNVHWKEVSSTSHLDVKNITLPHSDIGEFQATIIRRKDTYIQFICKEFTGDIYSAYNGPTAEVEERFEIIATYPDEGVIDIRPATDAKNTTATVTAEVRCVKDKYGFFEETDTYRNIEVELE